MASNLGVSLDKLVETVNNIREQNTRMKSTLSNVSGSVSGLRSSWDSPAAQNLQTISSKMSDRFLELEKDINAFATFLDGAIANYETTESQAQDIMQGVLGAFEK